MHYQVKDINIIAYTLILVFFILINRITYSVKKMKNKSFQLQGWECEISDDSIHHFTFLWMAVAKKPVVVVIGIIWSDWGLNYLPHLWDVVIRAIWVFQLMNAPSSIANSNGCSLGNPSQMGINAFLGARLIENFLYL